MLSPYSCTTTQTTQEEAQRGPHLSPTAALARLWLPSTENRSPVDQQRAHEQRARAIVNASVGDSTAAYIARVVRPLLPARFTVIVVGSQPNVISPDLTSARVASR